MSEIQEVEPAHVSVTRKRGRRVGGQWKYLFRAVDKYGRLIDFMLLDRRDTRAAHRFLSKAMKTMRNWPPQSITTDKLGSYPKAIRQL
ncbi:MAG TPA: DDE-type integrase/transposase/recombinase, partial [Granulicella sp.]|nr:DDE-type integrase/transposase/recombinase [Granulicella sp.]